MEVHLMIYDSKILNAWTNKLYFESIHGLLVSVFDKVSKLKFSYLQLNTRRVICKMPFFRKAKIVQKRKEEVIYALKATSRRQSGLFVYQITLKAFRMPQELSPSDVLRAF